MNWIKDIVNGLIETYNTSNIYELIDFLDITVIKKHMPKNVVGNFYRNEFGDEFIFISDQLLYQEEKYILAHELGHAILHTNLSVSYYSYNKFQIKNKYEIQADRFAAELLLPNTLNYDIENFNLEQLSSYFEVPTKLLKYKFFEKHEGGSSNWQERQIMKRTEMNTSE